MQAGPSLKRQNAGTHKLGWPRAVGEPGTEVRLPGKPQRTREKVKGRWQEKEAHEKVKESLHFAFTNSTWE